MTGLALGLSLAVLASLALNSGFLLQHVGSSTAPEVDIRRPLRTVVELLRSRIWSIGLGLGLAGWALHVGALANAPLSLVQAFVGGGLALAVPAGARFLRTRLKPAEVRAVLAMAFALPLLTIGLRASAGHPAPSSAMWIFVAVAGVLAALFAAVPSGLRRAHALGAAAGILYGIGDAATKDITAGAGAGVWNALASPWIGVLAVATAFAFFAFQRGLQLGPALPVIALMTAGTSVVSLVAAFAVFGDPLGHTPVLAAMHALAFGIVGVAAWRLAPASARLAGARSLPLDAGVRA